MTLDEIVKRAKQEPTIADALAIACLIELDRVLKSYQPGEVYETCFRSVIEAVLAGYYDDGVPDLTHYRADKKVRESMNEVSGLLKELLSR